MEINRVQGSEKVQDVKATATVAAGQTEAEQPLPLVTEPKDAKKALTDTANDYLGEAGEYLSTSVYKASDGKTYLRISRKSDDVSRQAPDSTEATRDLFTTSPVSIDLQGIAKRLGIPDNVMYADKDEVFAATQRTNPATFPNATIDPGSSFSVDITALGTRKVGLLNSLFTSDADKYAKLRALAKEVQ